MIKSMTGFGSAETISSALGKASLELRSHNHRFLEIVFNLPYSFSYLEDSFREEISRKIKRGRVIVSLNITRPAYEKIAINNGAIKNYLQALNRLRRQLYLKDEVTLDMLLRLPGAVSIGQIQKVDKRAQRQLKDLLQTALGRLYASRKKAGEVLYRDLKSRSEGLKQQLVAILNRAKSVIAQKASRIDNLEERTGFLKNADITEELTLLKFHLNNFRASLNKSIPVGKELDFIAQEMQREGNTLAAKSFDAQILAGVIEIKTQIEKMREQLQNVE